jgi:serine protease Do
MTQGIISAIGRSLPVGSGSSAQTTGPTYTIPDVIQTDAAINPGNSGGVLLNAQGEVIGVTSEIESSTNSSAGIGFVIPSDIVMKVIPQLIKNGKFEYSWLGIEGTDMTPAIAQAMNLKANQTGALIVSVTSGGPAAKAGLQGGNKSVNINGSPVQVGGDVIVSIDGQPINNFDDVVSYLFLNTQIGQTIKLGILRNGNPMTVSVVLGSRPSSSTANTQPQQSSATGGAWLGIGGIAMTSAVAGDMNLPSNTQGVLIEQVQSDSPASQAGLRAGSQTVDISGNQVTVGGDVIIGIDNQQVTDMNSLSSAIQQYNPGDTVILTIIRNGRQHQVQVTLGQMPTSYSQ